MLRRRLKRAGHIVSKTTRAPTIKDIANAVGVHSSTVSRVMNPATRHMVGDDVAKRVLRQAAKFRYLPNRMAASLRTNRTHAIGVILPDITNPVFPPILLGIEQALSEKGYVPLVANAGSELSHQQYVVDQMLARRVDGLIFATVTQGDPLLEHCQRNGIPIVTVNRIDVRGMVPGVASDNLLGMELTVAHLFDLGHRQIAHITGPHNVSTGMLRKKGFVKAMRSRHLEPMVIAGKSYTREAGRLACRELLRRFPQVTAIAAGNDLVAIGCYDALAEAGCRCPDYVSVVGHNDMPLADMLAPPLTTVRIAHHEMGAQAAKMLMEYIDGQTVKPVQLMLQPQLVVRQSTAKPRK